MTDLSRITAARNAVREAALSRKHVASRLLATEVSLNWEIACEAAERLAALEKENDALRTRLILEGIDD